MAGQIDVYSASAGSGKTYTIAMRFIDMLIDNPSDYQHILAVTFTNKATAEMMGRIVEDLYNITYNGKDDKKLENKQALINRQNKWRKECGRKEVSVEEIEARCKIALSLMLNDYGQFSVSTIDSFVQRVIRAFAFEQGLSSNYGVELDSTMIVNEAIDGVMNEMSENKELKTWILSYVKDKMEEEDGKWNIDREISELAKTLVSDNGKRFISEVDKADKDGAKKLKEATREVIRDTETKIVGLVREISQELGPNIKYAKGTIKELVNRLIQKGEKPLISYILSDKPETVWERWQKMAESINDDKAIVVKGKNKAESAEIEMVLPQVRNALRKLEVFAGPGFDTLLKYNTAREINTRIYVLGILQYISQQMNKWAMEHNTMPMANSNDLLSKLIADSEVPFIYEKIGSRYNHIMIDEFQDTSVMQWNNFKPLLKNSVDGNNENMLVGDTKQAIYRWRNTDWRILANVGNRDTEPELAHSINPKPLESNWRSYRHVVEFNNEMFADLKDRIGRHVADLMGHAGAVDNDITAVYDNCRQKPEKGTTGFVQVKILEGVSYKKKDKNGKESTRYSSVATTDYVIDDVVNSIVELRDKYGYKLGDICVLVRRKIEGTDIMNRLADMGIHSVSADSLLMINSSVVTGVIAALKYIVRPKDRVSLVSFISVSRYMSDGKSIGEIWSEKSEEIGILLRSLSGLNLLEMTNRIIATMVKAELVEAQYIFVEALMDTMRSYMSKYHVNVSDFLDYFDKVSGDLAVVAPTNENAVNVMTIHKSKGLEFKAVLIPYCDWKIDDPKKASTIWPETKNMPDEFRTFGILPVKYSGKLKYTYFASEAMEESKMLIVDSLNMLYVALTRAKGTLMVWGHKEMPGTNGDIVMNTPINFMSEMLKENKNGLGIESSEEEIDMGSNGNDEETEKEEDSDPSRVKCVTYTYGSLDKQAEEEKKEAGKKREKEETSSDKDNKTSIERHRLSGNWEIKLNKSKLENAEEDIRSIGVKLHGVMERIRVLEDFDIAFEEAVCEGEITTAEALELKKYLRNQMEKPEVKVWFDVDCSDVYNELSLMSRAEIIRPDRVVILPSGKVIIVDYKFGHHRDVGQYKIQVAQYAEKMKQAGFAEVEGYIWYLDASGMLSSEVVKVTE